MGAMDVVGPPKETSMKMVDAIGPLDDTLIEVADTPRGSLPLPPSISPPQPMHSIGSTLENLKATMELLKDFLPLTTGKC